MSHCADAHRRSLERRRGQLAFDLELGSCEGEALNSEDVPLGEFDAASASRLAAFEDAIGCLDGSAPSSTRHDRGRVLQWMGRRGRPVGEFAWVCEVLNLERSPHRRALSLPELWTQVRCQRRGGGYVRQCPGTPEAGDSDCMCAFCEAPLGGGDGLPNRRGRRGSVREMIR